MQEQNLIDEKYIRKCLELAKLAEGQVSPNPLVGSIVLDKNGKIVGRGHHIKCGEAHAEVCSLNEAGEKAEGGTIYVNLEPCSHFGRTPPCIDKVIKSGIKRLVIGMQDPNPLVAGKGIQKALNSGIEVKTGVLQDDCIRLNEIFIKHITGKKPFIAIKTASTLDGKIATKTGSSKWITSSLAREEVHRLRNKYDAILTGSGTIIKDNPSLNCRLESEKQLLSCVDNDYSEKCLINKQVCNPIRIIIDSKLQTPIDSKVYINDGTIIIIAVADNISDEKIKNYPEYIKFIKCPTINDKISLAYLVEELYHLGIYSVMVEAGGMLNGAFLKEGLIDKLYVFIAPKILGDKLALSSVESFNINDINQSLKLRFDTIKMFPPDLLIEAYLEN